jgi:hypothetical protein
MNDFDGENIDKSSFAWADLHDLHVFTNFVPVFGSLTVVGATSYSGRMYLVGALMFFEVKFSAATSIASTAGTDFLTLPFKVKGLAGHAVMTNQSTKIAVGNCYIDVANSRCYLPTQTASGNVFNLAGWTEI